MKIIFTVLVLFFVSSIMAQSIASIAYYKVPREEAAQFIRSHQKFTDLSSSDDRLLRGGGVFAHVHAENYTYVSYDFYDSVSDLEKDGSIAAAALKKNVDALKLTKKEKEALTKEYRKYNRTIYYNHYDQIRMANPEMSWNFQTADWTKKKITTLSKFKIKEGMQDQFFDAWKKGEFKNKQESGFVEAITGSWHLYGEGDHIHVYTFFDSWDNFASFEKASSYDVAKDMGENEKKFWSTV